MNDIFKVISDPLYSTSGQGAFISDSTISRSAGIQAAVQNGEAPINSPLNDPANPKVTEIKISNGFSSKLRLGTTAIRIKFVIHKRGDVNASVPPYDSIPSWSMIGRMISKVVFSINDIGGSNLFYSSNDGTFHEEFIARALTSYSWEQLNNMGETLFTPMADKHYITGSNKPHNSDAHIIDDSQIDRYEDYCNNEQSHNTVISKTIPLSLLCGINDSITNNIRDIRIAIHWTNSKQLLDSYLIDSDGEVSVIKCDALTDYYNPSMEQMQKYAILKNPNAPKSYEVYPILETEHRVGHRNSINSDIIFPSISNFHSVMIFQIANGNHNKKDDGVDDDGDTIYNRISYLSSGQFIFGQDTVAGIENQDGSIDEETLIQKRACDNIALTGSRLGWTSVQISYGDINYPDHPIELFNKINDDDDNATQDFAQLYAEYQKATNRFMSKDAIPYDVFKSVLPFALLRPYGVLPSINKTADLTIRLRGGTAATLFSIIIFKYRVATVLQNGISEKL